MKNLLIACLLLISLSLSAQDTALRVMFYNVENLFDTLDAPDKSDEEFLPSSELRHGSKNYWLKQEHISKVINASFGASTPDILGLCEVENKVVVEDLADKLRKQKKLKVVHEESLDQRGIDNAIIYDTQKLKLISHGVKEVELTGERPTRYILWAHFKMKKNDRGITVFVNHWPSRYGGQEASNWKRMTAANALSALTYELRQQYPNADEIAMGDFNDYPDNESVKQIESCMFPESPCMKNTHEYLQGTGKGSHAYKGEWGMLDQILVSKGLYSQKNEFYVPDNSGGIIAFDWMMYESNYDNELYPSRFYGRDKLYGGYSDHLPVYIAVLKKQ